MASLWPYVLGGALVAIPLAAAGKKSTSTPSIPMSARWAKFRCGFAATGLGADWMRFLETTAYRESEFNPRALNSSSGEKAASDSLNDKFGVISGINFGSSAWEFGSKGLFQFLGVVVALRSGTLRFPASMTNPDMAYDPGVAIAAAVDYARGLMKWDGFTGTWASLNVGWGIPSKMDDPAKLAASVKSMEDRAAKLGWARGWGGDRVPTVRDQSQNELAALAQTAKLYYDRC